MERRAFIAIHAGSVTSGDGWKVTVGHAQHVEPYLECLAFRIDTSEDLMRLTPADARVSTIESRQG